LRKELFKVRFFTSLAIPDLELSPSWHQMTSYAEFLFAQESSEGAKFHILSLFRSLKSVEANAINRGVLNTKSEFKGEAFIRSE
jgi:hypothetical protein